MRPESSGSNMGVCMVLSHDDATAGDGERQPDLFEGLQGRSWMPEELAEMATWMEKVAVIQTQEKAELLDELHLAADLAHLDDQVETMESWDQAEPECW